MAYLIYFFIECLSKEKMIIMFASNKTWYFKTLHLVFRNGNFCGLFEFHICYGKYMPFLNVGVIKHHQKLVYQLYEYLKQNNNNNDNNNNNNNNNNNDKGQKLACLLSGVPFPIKKYTQQCQHCKKQFIEMAQ